MWGGAARRTDSVGNNTKNTKRCVELFVTLGLRPQKAYASAKHVQDCQRETSTEDTELAHIEPVAERLTVSMVLPETSPSSMMYYLMWHTLVRDA